MSRIAESMRRLRQFLKWMLVRRTKRFRFVTIPIIVMMCYIASIAPAMWLSVNNYIPHRMLIMYIPLASLTNACPPFKVVMKLWVMLWCGEIG